MPSARTPRTESQAATRARLVATATRLIAVESIPGLSLRRVCAEAGLTQGAFYANFADKDALLIEVMERHLDEQQRQLSALSASLVDAGLDECLDAFAVWLRDLAGQRGWAALAIELRLHAHRDPDFGARLATAEVPMVARFGGLVADLSARHGLHTVISASKLAEMLLSLWYSAILRQTPAEAVDDVFMPVFRALLGRSVA